MEKIRTFVENMFLSLPDTQEVQKAKVHILEGMLDRYEALTSQGKNENEAFGIVIEEFGSVEELRQELGLSAEAVSPPSSPCVDFPHAEYEAFRKRYPIAIAAGTVICIVAIAVWYVLSRTAWAWEARLHYGIPVLMIAAAVGLFVYFGIQENHYQKLLRMNQTSFSHQGRNDNDPLHGVIILSATAIYLGLGFFLNLWHPGWIVFILGAALCRLTSAFHQR